MSWNIWEYGIIQSKVISVILCDISTKAQFRQSDMSACQRSMRKTGKSFFDFLSVAIRGSSSLLLCGAAKHHQFLVLESCFLRHDDMG